MCEGPVLFISRRGLIQPYLTFIQAILATVDADGLVCTGTSSASAVILEGMNQTAAGGMKLFGPFTEARVLQTPCWGPCYSMIWWRCCLLEPPICLLDFDPTNQPKVSCYILNHFLPGCEPHFSHTYVYIYIYHICTCTCAWTISAVKSKPQNCLEIHQNS